MPRPGRRRQVERSRWRQFRMVGESFAQAPQMATQFQSWTAAGVLLVHGAVALTDALTVKMGGVKSTGEDHMLGADLLEIGAMGVGRGAGDLDPARAITSPQGGRSRPSAGGAGGVPGSGRQFSGGAVTQGDSSRGCSGG